MNGNSNDYQLAQAHMARIQHQAEQHQLAQEVTDNPKPTRESLLGKLVNTIRRRIHVDAKTGPIPVPPMPPHRKRLA